MRKFVLFAMALLVGIFPSLAFALEEGDPLLKAAIFVQNRAGADFDDRIEVLNDFISSRLTEKGFSILDRNVVLAKFRESKTAESSLARSRKALEELIELGKSESSVEDALTGASALRLSQMIGADYIVLATISSFGTETRTFKGEGTVYGTDNSVTICNLRLSLKVLEGNGGGSVYGDVVTASERISVGRGLTIETDDLVPRLLDSGAGKIAENIAGRVERIRNVKVKTVPAVEFTVRSNVEGATVELDGAVIGTTPGPFYAPPGLHQLRISKEWLSTWERTVNIVRNQVLNVSLELSPEGMARYATIEALKIDLERAKQDVALEGKEREAAIGIAREQSEAEAYATKKVAEGEKARREASYERIEGTPTIQNNILK